MNSDLPIERKLKALRVDLVGATPVQIAEQLIRVSPRKAAHVALLIVASVGPSIMTAVGERVNRIADRVQNRPVQTAGRLLTALMQDDPPHG